MSWGVSNTYAHGDFGTGHVLNYYRRKRCTREPQISRQKYYKSVPCQPECFVVACEYELWQVHFLVVSSCSPVYYEALGITTNCRLWVLRDLVSKCRLVRRLRFLFLPSRPHRRWNGEYLERAEITLLHSRLLAFIGHPSPHALYLPYLQCVLTWLPPHQRPHQRIWSRLFLRFWYSELELFAFRNSVWIFKIITPV